MLFVLNFYSSWYAVVNEPQSSIMVLYLDLYKYLILVFITNITQTHIRYASLYI